MHVEKLSLEVEARRVGLNVIKPPNIRGRSGVEHTFSFLASVGGTSIAIDIYEEVTQAEVIKTYIKKLDTGASADVLCTTSIRNEAAEKLAREYGMRILTMGKIVQFFDSMVLRKHSGNARQASSLLSA